MEPTDNDHSLRDAVRAGHKITVRRPRVYVMSTMLPRRCAGCGRVHIEAGDRAYYHSVHDLWIARECIVDASIHLTRLCAQLVDALLRR